MAATASWSSLPPDILGPIFAFLSPSPAHLRNASTAEDLPVAIAVVVLPPCSESRAYFDRAETTSCWKTLLNVALSCRAWSLPALCSLWSNIVIFRRSQAEQLIGVLLRSVEQANGTAAPVYLAYHTFVKSIDFTSLETDTASLFISLTQLVQPFLLSVRLCQSITSSSPVEFERVMSALLACPRLQHLTLVRGVSAAPLRSTHIEQISRRHIRVIGSGAMTKVRPIWLHAHTEEEGGGVVHEPIPDPSIQELLGNMLTLDWGSDVNAFGLDHGHDPLRLPKMLKWLNSLEEIHMGGQTDISPANSASRNGGHDVHFALAECQLISILRPTLRVLDLRNCMSPAFGDSALRALAESAPRLEVLRLHQCDPSDLGLHVLANAPLSRTLRVLQLCSQPRVGRGRFAIGPVSPLAWMTEGTFSQSKEDSGVAVAPFLLEYDEVDPDNSEEDMNNFANRERYRVTDDGFASLIRSLLVLEELHLTTRRTPMDHLSSKALSGVLFNHRDRDSGYQTATPLAKLHTFVIDGTNLVNEDLIKILTIGLIPRRNQLRKLYIIGQKRIADRYLVARMLRKLGGGLLELGLFQLFSHYESVKASCPATRRSLEINGSVDSQVSSAKRSTLETATSSALTNMYREKLRVSISKGPSTPISIRAPHVPNRNTSNSLPTTHTDSGSPKKAASPLFAYAAHDDQTTILVRTIAISCPYLRQLFLESVYTQEDEITPSGLRTILDGCQTLSVLFVTPPLNVMARRATKRNGDGRNKTLARTIPAGYNDSLLQAQGGKSLQVCDIFVQRERWFTTWENDSEVDHEALYHVGLEGMPELRKKFPSLKRFNVFSY